MSRYSYSTCPGFSHHRASHDPIVWRERGLEPESSDLFSRVFLHADTDRHNAHGRRKSPMLAKFCQVLLFFYYFLSSSLRIQPPLVATGRLYLQAHPIYLVAKTFEVLVFPKCLPPLCRKRGRDEKDMTLFCISASSDGA